MSLFFFLVDHSTIISFGLLCTGTARFAALCDFSLDELAYVETLFGHQDEIVDIDALAQERCVSVGARDRTARLWKVVEETLVEVVEETL